MTSTRITGRYQRLSLCWRDRFLSTETLTERYRGAYESQVNKGHGRYLYHGDPFSGATMLVTLNAL